MDTHYPIIQILKNKLYPKPHRGSKHLVEVSRRSQLHRGSKEVADNPNYPDTTQTLQTSATPSILHQNPTLSTPNPISPKITFQNPVFRKSSKNPYPIYKIPPQKKWPLLTFEKGKQGGHFLISTFSIFSDFCRLIIPLPPTHTPKFLNRHFSAFLDLECRHGSVGLSPPTEDWPLNSAG